MLAMITLCVNIIVVWLSTDPDNQDIDYINNNMFILRWLNIVQCFFLEMICLYLIKCLNLFWRSLMWFLRPLVLIKFRQPAIIAVITMSVHHTFALPANTGPSPNNVSKLSTVFDAGSTFKQHGENASCFLG